MFSALYWGNHNVTKWMKQEWTSGDLLVQPLGQAGQAIKQIAQDCVQLGPKYLHGWRLHSWENLYDHQGKDHLCVLCLQRAANNRVSFCVHLVLLHKSCKQSISSQLAKFE